MHFDIANGDTVTLSNCNSEMSSTGRGGLRWSLQDMRFRKLMALLKGLLVRVLWLSYVTAQTGNGRR